MLGGFISRAKNRILWHGDKGWSGCMGQYNLIQCAVENDQGFNWFKNSWGVFIKGDKSAEVSDVLEETLIKNIEKAFAKVFSMRDYACVVEKIRSSWINNSLDRYDKIKDEIGGKPFDEWVVAWHVATDICYFAFNEEKGQVREAVRKISNYMMYLVHERQTMMPPSPGIPEIRAERTLKKCRELYDSILVRMIGQPPVNSGLDESGQARMILYHAVMAKTKDDMQPEWYKYVDPLDTKNSALSTSHKLVNLLKEIVETESEEQLWEVIGGVWMDVLSYAAVQCSRTEHERCLSTGGELLTHYWLLLAHYGVLEPHNITHPMWFYTMVRDDLMYS